MLLQFIIIIISESIQYTKPNIPVMTPSLLRGYQVYALNSNACDMMTGFDKSGA